MRSKLIAVTLALVAAVATGCTTQGTGSGTLRNGAAPAIAFEWRSSDTISGTMTATFTDGRSFTGSYFQITSDARIDRMGPLWDGWNPRWYGWRHWHPDPGPDFVKYYSGRVLANLVAADGERMRCRFQLIRPASGMAAGGQGQCQLGNGRIVDATFPPG